MDGSLGHFKATLQRRKERQEKKIGQFGEKSLNSNYSSGKSFHDFPEFSPTELEQIKIAIRQRMRAEHKRQCLLAVFIITGIAVGLLIALHS